MTDKPPDALEGSEILLTGKKIIINPGPPILAKTLNGEMLAFPVSLERDGDAEIIAEYPKPEPKIRTYSKVIIGDKISGRRLWGFTDRPQTGKVKKGGKGRSARHTGQQMMLKGPICFMEIIHGYRGDVLPVHPRKDLSLN